MADVDDPQQLGRLRVIIPGFYEAEEVFPEWVLPRFPAAGPGAVAAWLIPPVGSHVVVEVDQAGELRWRGGDVGAVNLAPEFLVGNYPHRAGFTSPAGGHALALDDDVGLLALVTDPDDPDGVAAYLSVDAAADEAKIGLRSGTLLQLASGQVVALTAAGNLISADDETGIMLALSSGTEVLALEPGLAKLNGTEILLAGGVVTVIGQGGITLRSDLAGIAPVEPLILGTSFLTDFLAAIPEWQAAATAWGLPTVNTATLVASITAALGAGAPYLSNVTSTE